MQENKSVHKSDFLKEFTYEENRCYQLQSPCFLEYCNVDSGGRQGRGREGHLDVGIALAHLYVNNEKSFRFFKAESPPEVTGYTYIGSYTL